MSNSILPGATLGILGSGQLGRMLALEAKRMGYRVHIYSPDTNTPAGEIANQEFSATYDDLEQLQKFAQSVDVVTLEFENIPIEALNCIQQHVPVHPNPNVLWTTQNRLREKTFLKQYGFPTAQFCKITSLEELTTALGEIGIPSVLKTAGFGYDGKGQTVIRTLDQATDAFRSLQGQEGILEEFVDFSMECSVVGARTADDEFAHFGVIENIHHQHILDVSIAPGRVSPQIAQQAVEVTHQVMRTLEVVGVLCVEFFLTKEHQLLVNELAPRPHNSGHLTLDAAITNQFEQQLRAVCGLSLGSTVFLCSAAMVNLLGDLWQNGEPNWQGLCQLNDVKLHLYGKKEARAGRKMGHMTALGSTYEAVLSRVQQAKSFLQQ